MRSAKKFNKFPALLFAFIIAISGKAFAATYSDVPSWASAAVDKVTSLGYMVGDVNGKFNPSDYIDKFETSKILAKMLGYKATGATAAEQAYYDSCHDTYKGYISLFSNKFTKWNSTTNKEVAFLLAKGVYTYDDLNQFVLIVDGQERLKALTKEEASVFLVRLMGKEAAAKSATAGKLFSDDNSISSSAKPYVYYLRNAGAVSGDEQNKFNPKSSVTRVIMAVMVNNVYLQMNPSANTGATPPPSSTQAPAATNPPANYETVTGTISKLYSSFRAIQVSSTNDNYNNKIYIVTSTASVTIGGVQKTYNDLTEGMSFVALLSNGELTSVTVSGEATNPSPTAAPIQPPALGLEYSNIEGTVTSVRTENGVNNISIEVKMLNTRGEIYAETRTFALASGCTITRGSSSLQFSSIIAGDLIKAKVSGSYAYSLQLEEKNRTLSGEITNKQFKTTTSLPIITITDSSKQSHDLRVGTNSSLYRRGVGYVNWNDLRIGDTIEVELEYDMILSLTATGSTSNKEGYIKDIYISSDFSRVTVTDDNNVDSTYNIIPGAVDPYTLKIGNRMKFRLDSKEISSVTLLEDASTASLTGIVSYVTSNTIGIKDSTSNYVATRNITFNSNTIFLDAASGNKVTYLSLYSDMKVFVLFADNSSTLAKSVTILGR